MSSCCQVWDKVLSRKFQVRLASGITSKYDNNREKARGVDIDVEKHKKPIPAPPEQFERFLAM
jgi:hypothetical protein